MSYRYYPVRRHRRSYRDAKIMRDCRRINDGVISTLVEKAKGICKKIVNYIQQKKAENPKLAKVAGSIMKIIGTLGYVTSGSMLASGSAANLVALASKIKKEGNFVKGLAAYEAFVPVKVLLKTLGVLLGSIATMVAGHKLAKEQEELSREGVSREMER